jgi:putative oxidoreductase
MNRAALIRTGKTVAPWVPALLLATIFVPQGWAKFSDTSGWARAFDHWGYPVWFRILVGTTELLAVALLLSGRAAAYGALLIIVTMLGAWATHLTFDHGRHMTSELVPLVLASIVLVLRRRQLSGLRSRQREASRLP